MSEHEDLIDKDPPWCFIENGPNKGRYTKFGASCVDEFTRAIGPIADKLYKLGVSTRDVQAMIIETSMDVTLSERLTSDET